MLDENLPWGATPIEDSSGLKLQWVKTRNQLNEVEARNILKVSSRYFFKRSFPLKWFHEKSLKKIHSEMFGHVWDWAGLYYRGPLRNIGIECFYIPIQIRELCGDVLYWLENKTNLTFLEQSARIHFRLAQIHPFHNGNGRHARLIADLYLLSLFGEGSRWPEKILVTGGNLRKEYIESLKEADRGDYSLLISLTLKYGGKNPSVASVLSNPKFSQQFSQEKLFETVTNLLNFGSSSNELSPEGYHPLQLAIRRGSGEIVTLLVKSGANIRQKDKSGLTPLEWAERKENQQLIAILQ